MIAALWMGGTLLSFLLMAIGGRELSASLDTGEILFYRSVIGLVGFVFYAEPVSIAVMVGAAIMVAGNYLNVRAEQGARYRFRRRRPP